MAAHGSNECLLGVREVRAHKSSGKSPSNDDDDGASRRIHHTMATFPVMHSSQMLRWTTVFLLVVMASSFSTLHISCKTAPSCRQASMTHGALSDSRINEGMKGSLLSERKVPTETTLVYMFPVAAAMSAFTFYEGVSKGFHEFVQAASRNNWIPVDGGQLIGDVILPAINGPVLGTIGLLFATLVSTTISNLYQRQMNIHSCIVREVDDLRRLGYLLKSLPEPYRGEAQTELKFFVNTIFKAARERSHQCCFVPRRVYGTDISVAQQGIRRL